MTATLWAALAGGLALLLAGLRAWWRRRADARAITRLEADVAQAKGQRDVAVMTQAATVAVSADPGSKRLPDRAAMTAAVNPRSHDMSDRSLSNHDMTTATASTADIVTAGDPGAWVVVCKASSKAQGWMKSTKRLKVPGGWLYQVTTEHRAGGVASGYVTACAEALAFVPDAGMDP